MKKRAASTTILLSLAVAIAGIARAEFAPIPLTAESFNQDVVVEKTAPTPIVVTTTATMDAGTGNTGYTWYEKTYLVDFPATGLPRAGSTVSGESIGGYDYQFAPNYKTNNVVLIDSTITSGRFTLTAPSAFANLSFLTSGGVSSGTIGYVVHHENGVTESGTLACPYWFGGSFQAVTAHGEVDIGTYNCPDLNSDYPRVHSRDIALTDSTSPVTSIDFNYTSGTGHNVVFAVSGAPTAGDAFTPITVTGYNEDMIVEAGTARPDRLSGVTTATMERGMDNLLRTFYEKGYFPTDPTTGLPTAGATFASAAASDHQYQMPASYRDNNVVLLDLDNSSATLTPVAPVACAGLSFLTTAANGPVTIGCVIHHADGTSESRSFVAPDWLDTAPAAFAAHGRVSINNRIVDSASNPKLYAADITLANATSPVTSIDVAFTGGASGSHAVVFAVSGGSSAPVAPPTLAVVRGAGNTLTLSSSGPGKLQSTTALNGTNTVWNDEGSISGSKSLTPSASEPAKFYRALAP